MDGQSSKNKLMTDIAKMYYLDGMSQEDIAKTLHMSRSNISRLLAKSIESGIVQISIHDSRCISPEVAHRIAKRWGLQEVLIVNSFSEPERTRRAIGEAAANFLMEHMSDRSILGISRGNLVYYTSRAVHAYRGSTVQVVQMMGCTANTSALQDSYMLTEAFARRLNGISHVMPVPLMCKTKQTRDLLLQEPLCKNVMEMYPSINIALLEIQPLNIRLSAQLRESWLTNADALQLSEVYAVAAVCGYYFDAIGASCNTGINNRICAIDYNLLKTLPMRIGLALDKNMLEPTLAILRSKLLTNLIIDESLAFRLDAGDLPRSG